ncbi:peptidoglycan DD-metalloendopeptidase family protein [Leeuwenhoekiella aequorea]|uniref:Murein DD-endopeptidase MepM/ murein hydrolase activator NlpD n=1 Tax=Leeuwenhoekiella aequorea TaxID=283736 RepID=A0A4Q0PC97_9FLAO|nr:M23 family metallopeptidase [Leeuwenhoekiella aequorea]RXG24430.1 murein DD-endopeptidase MepM/ murein hydrolase activator NlpD [Leeuwenhoekiella aequorea]
MKNKLVLYFSIIAVFFVVSCDKITKATDFITQPTAREIYARNFKNDSVPYIKWNAAFKSALADSLNINSPYLETGKFNPEIYPVYSYEVSLEQGRVYNFMVETDSLNPLVFLNLYEKTQDSLHPYRLIEEAAHQEKKIRFSTKNEGVFKIIVQPELGAKSTFAFRLTSTPAYHFPVAGASANAIQSFWGATRDGGKRSHEGVDIFAARGTPVVASVPGFVGRTGNRGLGGKQVWLRERMFGNSLYYAHLDSIIARNGQRVEVGDTLGLVGNTGNARTTAPHLHFGIYSSGSGAINPYPFIKEESPIDQNSKVGDTTLTHRIRNNVANLRNAASAKANKIGEVTRNDTIRVLGKSNGWLHIETFNSQRAYLHESLVK